jgi:hypothetical protein
LSLGQTSGVPKLPDPETQLLQKFAVIEIHT